MKYIPLVLILIGSSLLAQLVSAQDTSQPSELKTAPSPLPNIIIVYADDLGFGDLSCYNSDCRYSTPRLDQMAKEGIRFTDAHSPSTICSPSRYGLFSGQQIYRSTGRGGGAFEGPGGPSYLKPGTLTIAQMLKTKGYRTGPDLAGQGWETVGRRIQKHFADRLREKHTAG